MALPKPEITIPQLPSGPLEPTDVFIATNAQGASKKVTGAAVKGAASEAAQESVGPVVVATHAAMLTLAVEGKPRQFQVTTDEVSGGTDVNYFWNGEEASEVSSNKAKSIATYAAMLASPEGFYKVVADENSGRSNVVYYWNGASAEPIEFRILRVETFAEMESLLRVGQSQKFTVLDDEVQGIEKVPYEWDGVELFVYGTLVEPQPTIA
jgi:plastocyanin